MNIIANTGKQIKVYLPAFSNIYVNGSTNTLSTYFLSFGDIEIFSFTYFTYTYREYYL